MAQGRGTLSLFVNIVLLLSLMACGGGSHNNNGGNTPAPPPSNTGTGGGGSSIGTQFVYTANAMSFTVSGFKLNEDGSLSPVPGSPALTHSQAPFIFTPWAVAQAGKYLLVGDGTPNTATGWETFAIDPTTGALTGVNPPQPTTGANDFNADGGFAAVDQSRMQVVFAGEFSQAIPNGVTGGPAIAAYQVNSDGSLSPIGNSFHSMTTGPVALDPNGHFVYLIGGGQIAAIVRNADGSLGGYALGSPMALAGSPPPFNGTADASTSPCVMSSQGSIVVSPNAKFIYTTCGGVESTNVYSVDASGRLTFVSNYAPNTPAMDLSSIALNPAGTMAIGTDEVANTAIMFSVDPNTGALKQGVTINAGTRPNSAACDKTGTFAYVTNGSTLMLKGSTVPGSNNISGYKVSSTGEPTPTPNSPYGTGMAPRSIVVVKP